MHLQTAYIYDVLITASNMDVCNFCSVPTELGHNWCSLACVLTNQGSKLPYGCHGNVLHHPYRLRQHQQPRHQHHHRQSNTHVRFPSPTEVSTAHFGQQVLPAADTELEVSCERFSARRSTPLLPSCPSVRPTVCLSHWWSTPKRFTVSKYGLHLTIC